MGRKIVSGHGAKTSASFIGDSEFCNTNAHWEEIAEEEETTNSCSAGKNQYESGNTHVEGSLEADWDVANNPYDDPPQLRSGMHTKLRIYVHSVTRGGGGSYNGATGPFFDSDDVVINNVRCTVPAKGKVHVSFNFKTNGNYTLPTGSDSTSGL